MTGARTRFAHEMVATLGELGAATGTRILWRPALIADRGELPQPLVVHQHPWCMAHKIDPATGAHCRHDCDLYAEFWQRRGTEPLLRTCHAGLRECLVPIVPDGRYRGCYFIGLHRDPRHPSADAAEIAELPPADDRHLLAVAAVVRR